MTSPVLPVRIAALTLVFACGNATTRAHADALDERVEQAMRDHQIPGLSLAIVRDGVLLKARGYGKASLDSNAPATVDTVYQIGSISKTFTAAAVMLLVEQGKLALDDPLDKFPTAQALPEALRALTLRQLISHTSGVRSFSEIPAFSYRRDYSRDAFLKLIAAQPLDFEPGSKFHYSNTGPSLAALAVGEASGQPFERFVSEGIFRPLEMTHTGFAEPETDLPDRAAGYRVLKGEFGPGNTTRPRVIAASGGILSTVLDLVKYDAALDGEGLLPRSTLQTMWTRVRLSDGSRSPYGLGWFLVPVHGHPRIHHGGSTAGGFEASYQRFPEFRLSVIVLSNRQSAPVGKLATDLAELVEPRLAAAE